jgi:FkbM family methyltransferase
MIGAEVMTRLKDTSGFKRTKRFLKQLTGQDIWMSPQVKRDTLNFGDWCIDPRSINKDSVIYSLGIGEDIEFDLGMIQRFGVKVHAFDPTPNSINWVQDRVGSEDFIFHPYGISNVDEMLKIFPRVDRRGKKSTSMFSVVDEGACQNDGIEVQMHTLNTIMKKLGHTRIDILKMDIEASEYSVLDDVLQSGIDIDQILVEFHHRFKSVGNDKTTQAIRKLNDEGYQIFFISDLGREYSFIRSPR